MSKDPGYIFKYAVTQGWVELPVLDNKRALRHDRKLDRWAEDKARAMLGNLANSGNTQVLTHELVSLTYGARARNAMHSLALFPPNVSSLTATLDVKRLVPDRDALELTFAVLRDLYASPAMDTIGDVEATRIDLPSGPALRVHRKRAEQSDPTGESLVIEGITHAIRPPGTSDAIVMIMTWAALQLGDRLAEMADAIAASVEVTPTR